MTRPKMTKIRRAAKGQQCTLRLPGCNWRAETTVLAHLPSLAKGTGIKSPDYHAVFACSDCHDAIDRRRYREGVSRELILERCIAGLYETHKILIDAGIIEVKQ